MTTRAETLMSRPWHREPWPWLLMTGPAVVIVAGFATLWMAIASDDGLVADDYYRRGLAINQTLSRGQAARDLGLSAEVTINDAAGRIHVTVHGVTVMPEVLQLRLVHPTRAIADQILVMKKSGADAYETTLNAPVEGRRIILIEDMARHWRLAGEMAAAGPSKILAVPQ